jgi:hypothetical protein
MRQYVNFRKEPSPQRGTAEGWEKQQEDHTIPEHLLPFDVEPTLADGIASAQRWKYGVEGIVEGSQFTLELT